MNLIFIYGAPAVGKLTVATELSKLTKYSLFHNHLTVDLAKNLFDYNTKEFAIYRDKLRYEFIEIAAKNKINVIFTFCYAPNNRDDKFVKEVINIVQRYKGKVHFVYIHADKKQLEMRVKQKSRQRFAKVKTVSLLRRMLRKYNNFPKIPFVESLEINNTNISPKSVASQIKKRYHL